MLIMVSAWLCCVLSGIATDQRDDTETDVRLEYLVQRLQQFTLKMRDGNNGQAELRTAPIFRWKNPVSNADGGVFLWTHHGRPVLFSKTHVNDRVHCYVESMTPLTAEPFELRRGDSVQWAPTSSDAQRHRFDDIESPAATKGLRLTQMRSLARRYRMTSLWGEPLQTEWELRLLTTPLHRYEAAQEGILDGAIFGYAQGTNPEAVVIVEAVDTDKGPVWEAFPARLTGYAVSAWLDEELVLKVPLSRGTAKDAPYYHRHEVLVPYPFAADAVGD